MIVIENLTICMTFNKQPDPLFEVKESPLKKHPGTLKEFLVEAPQYFFAFLIYIDILILYYLVAMTGGLLLAFTTGYGLYSYSHSAFQVFCLVFSGHCLGSLMFLRIFLGNEKRLRWFYDHVGERRVKYMLFATPFLAFVSRTSVPALVGILGLEAGSAAHDAVIFQLEKTHELNEAIRIDTEAKARAYADFKQKVTETEGNPGFVKSAQKLFDHQVDTSQKQYEKTVAQVAARTHTPVGLVTKGMNSETLANVTNNVGSVFERVFGKKG